MNKIIMYLKTNKTLLLITIIMIISFIFGLLFPAFLSNSNMKLLSNSLKDFFNGLKSDNLNLQEAFLSSFFINILSVCSIWIFGISIIGFILIIILLFIYSFILGFSFSSIISLYGFRGILLAFIYIIPNIMDIFVIFVLSYYAINFSIMLYLYLFKNHKYNRRLIVKRYIKILFFSLFFSTLSSVIEVFIIPSILKKMI